MNAKHVIEGIKGLRRFYRRAAQSGLLLIVMFAGRLNLLAENEIKVWAGDYVPEPIPIKTKTQVAVYYFPGWAKVTEGSVHPLNSILHWERLIPIPDRRTLLGFYDDNSPEALDWQIYWMVGHGISTVFFDWYWNSGEKAYYEALEKGFLNAEYNKYLKFAVMWCYHPLPEGWKKRKALDASPQAMEEMTRYWIANYFKRENYLTMNGRPVILIFGVDSLVKDAGGPGAFRRTLAKMNALMHAAGYQDIYLCSVAARQQPDLKAVGFDCLTEYATHGLAMPTFRYKTGLGYNAPYEYLWESTYAMWKNIYHQAQQDKLDYILPMQTSWDNTPLFYLAPKQSYGSAWSVGFSPEKFRRGISSPLLKPDPKTGMIVIDAWNELTEGEILMPMESCKFRMLEAVRDTFAADNAATPHVTYVPSAAAQRRFSVLTPEAEAKAVQIKKMPEYCKLKTEKLGYRREVDPVLPVTKMLKQLEFKRGDKEGCRFSDVTFSTSNTNADFDGISYIQKHGGVIAFPVDLDIARIGCISLRIRVTAEAANEAGYVKGAFPVFYTTASSLNADDEKKFLGQLQDDNKFHIYSFIVKPDAPWTGICKSLRFDIGALGQKVDVDWIRIYEARPMAAN